jgi:hypothetical protein
MQFTFKRDSEGRETIHVADVAIARVTDHPEGFEWLSSPPSGVTAEHVREAAVKADEMDFWTYNTGYINDARNYIQRGDYTPEEMFGTGGWSNVPKEVTVDVPIAETSSTVLSLTTEDER